MVNSDKIKTIIVEDCKESLILLSSIIQNNFSHIEITETASNINDALKKINLIKPELVLLDIELTDGYSFEILEQLPKIDFEVIFVTAFDNFHKKAMDYYALNYITKPIDKQKLVNTINHYITLRERVFSQAKYNFLKSFLKEDKPYFLIHTGKEHISVRISDIIKIQADGNYAKFFLKNNTYLASNSLKYYEGLFLNKGFFKPNRSTLINLDHIRSIYKKESIKLSNNDNVLVSIRNKNKLTDLLKLLS
jgi:two-component system LytT family response regulator